jgi:hypothetical protein
LSDSPTDKQPHQTDKQDLQASPKPILKESGAIYVGALLLVLACVLVASAVPIVAQNLYALVAAVFVGLPYWWLTRKGWSFERFGLTWERAGRGAIWGLVFTSITLGPFAVGYWWWETKVLEREYAFSVDNFFKWPVELDGRPDRWGQESGVWTWTSGQTLHIGMRAGQEPVEVTLNADEAFRPRVIGPATLRGPDGKVGPGEHSEWTIELAQPHKRTEVRIGRPTGGGTPDALRINAWLPESDAPVVIRQGAAEIEADSTVEIDRGLTWIVLWVLTQLVFIALPEEFFYRGYLQTRLSEAFAARRRARGESESEGEEGRRVLGISASNALTSVLFALGHVLIPVGGAIMITRAAVFFPSLVFGWLRERTDTIAASVVYHAGANLMVLMAAPHFY